MSRFFNNFPRITYDNSGINGTGPIEPTRDLTARFRLIDYFRKYEWVYYIYNVKEGERADVIAEKYYGSSEYDWLIYMTNDMFDPILDWPMSSNVFNKYIVDKYGSISYATQNIKQYEIIISEKEELEDQSFSNGRYVIVDFDTYSQYPAERRRTVTYYDWEFEQNEKKRQIKLIDRQFLGQIQSEFDSIFLNNTTNQ